LRNLLASATLAITAHLDGKSPTLSLEHPLLLPNTEH
jgi:hypothetical protein